MEEIGHTIQFEKNPALHQLCATAEIPFPGGYGIVSAESRFTRNRARGVTRSAGPVDDPLLEPDRHRIDMWPQSSATAYDNSGAGARVAAERPKHFFRGYDVLDPVKVGFVSQGPEAERIGFRYDTNVAGNSNGGHLWGTTLSPEDKRGLIEYLKTLDGSPQSDEAPTAASAARFTTLTIW